MGLGRGLENRNGMQKGVSSRRKRRLSCELKTDIEGGIRYLPPSPISETLLWRRKIIHFFEGKTVEKLEPTANQKREGGDFLPFFLFAAGELGRIGDTPVGNDRLSGPRRAV